MPDNRRRAKTNPSNVRNLNPPPDTTSGGEPGQTEEERGEWKSELRKEAQEKTADRARPKKAAKTK
jgi:hypothetical protein